MIIQYSDLNLHQCNKLSKCVYLNINPTIRQHVDLTQK